MKTLKIALLITATASLSWVNAVTAQTSIIVDEFGLGSINGNSLQAVATNSTLGLQYNLGFVVVPGQVQIMDSANQISDLLIFTNTFLFFQSDSRNGFTAPADVASFSFDSSPIFQINEINGKGIWAPAVGQAGYNSNNPNYTFISDVPEPGTAALMGLAGVAFLLVIRRAQAGSLVPQRAQFSAPSRRS
jgi:PEP-CTERM motif